MRASATTKLNALRMMVASGVIRSAYSERDKFIHRHDQIPTENLVAEFDHLAPINAPLDRHVAIITFLTLQPR